MTTIFRTAKIFAGNNPSPWTASRSLRDTIQALGKLAAHVGEPSNPLESLPLTSGNHPSPWKACRRRRGTIQALGKLAAHFGEPSKPLGDKVMRGSRCSNSDERSTLRTLRTLRTLQNLPTDVRETFQAVLSYDFGKFSCRAR